MNLEQKITILGPSASYDTCGPKDFGKTTKVPGVYHAKVAGQHICRLFKVLQTNYCVNNCQYCAFRRDRSTPRTTASPDEMAKAFINVYQRRLVDGFFLSSGIADSAESTMSRLLDTAHILRDRYHYKGYLHLKIVPSVSTSCIEEASKLAQRISLNIEAPSEADLAILSPEKKFKQGFFHTLSIIKNVIAKRIWAGQKAPSLTTQFVVGAGSETDGKIIQTTHLLYKNFGLKRVFYSAFRPVLHTPLADKPAESLTREHRLYQTDFLMRFYQFKPWEIPLNSVGFLEESLDPKTAWAKQHPELYPINLNQANYWQLLKIPGVGPVSAKKIIQLRAERKIKSVEELAKAKIGLLVSKMRGWSCV